MDYMLQNGIKSIVELARLDIFRKVFTGIAEDTYLNMVTGEHKIVAKDEPPISHTLMDLDSLILMIEQQHGLNDYDGFIATFVSPQEVVTITDYQSFRAQQVKMPLSQSPILAFLKQPHESDPKNAIRALKYNLKSAYEGLEIVQALQTLKFESNSTAEHTNRTADEGVSKSLKSKVTGSAEIPDEFSVVFEIYPSMAHQLPVNGHVQVKMELHVDPSEGTVSFRPFPGAIESAIITGAEMVRSEIARRLKERLESEVARMVFLGKP